MVFIFNKPLREAANSRSADTVGHVGANFSVTSNLVTLQVDGDELKAVLWGLANWPGKKEKRGGSK